jgi:hypothetical protein
MFVPELHVRIFFANNRYMSVIHLSIRSN